MELLLIRKYLKNSYTIGDLYINGEFFCNTLEDTNRDLNKNGKFDSGEVKIKENTCIPFGSYEVTITYSSRFKRELPILLNVPNFTGIRIQRGNTHKDTSGCILVGENIKQGRVLNSTKYELELTKILKECISRKEKVIITIT